VRIRTRLLVIGGSLAATVIAGLCVSIVVIRDVSEAFRFTSHAAVPAIVALEQVRFAGSRIIGTTAEVALAGPEDDENETAASAVGEREADELQDAWLHLERAIAALDQAEGALGTRGQSSVAAARLREASVALATAGPRFLDARATGGNASDEEAERERLEQAERAFLDLTDAEMKRLQGVVAAAEADVRDTLRLAMWSVIILAVVLPAAIVLAFDLLSRRVVRPIARLEAASRAIAAGEIDTAIDVDHDAGQADEVGHLAASFSRMRTNLRTSHAALERHTAQLESSNRELQEFAYVASHDLQEPLRKIQAFGDRLATRCGGELPPDGQDYLRRMQDAARRMRALIDDLLMFSRVTTQGHPFRTIDLNDTVRGVLADLEVTVDRLGAAVEVGALPEIEADPTQMRQLFQNLIGNALKFARPGETPRVTVGVAPDDAAPAGAVTIEVRDNGIGFEQKYHDRIFQVFQRLHGRHEFDGSGIGLAVCRKIADRHHGFVRAEGRPGHGSTFFVTLPVTHAREERAA
jgi:signal transduction histidine kinase